MKKFRYLFITLIFLFVLAGCDQLTPGDPSLLGVSDITIDQGDEYNLLEGITAEDFNGDDLTDSIEYEVKDTSGNIIDFTTEEAFIYRVDYTVTNSAGNSVTETRIITVVSTADTTAPVLSGLADRIFNTGDVIDLLDGVSALDDVDGVLTLSIEITITNSDSLEIDEIDSLVLGEYTVLYRVTDDTGNSATDTITVSVIDDVPPVITLEETYTFTNDVVIDLITLGTISDNYDTNLVYDSITVYDEDENVIESNDMVVGTYRVVYDVYDSSFNVGYGETTLIITDAIAPVIEYDMEFIHVFVVTTFDPFDYFTVSDDTTAEEDLIVTVQYNDENLDIVTDISAPGNYTMMVTVVDEGGNETSMPFALNTDPIPIIVDSLSVEIAINFIEEFYADMLALDTAAFCNKYVEDVPYDMELDVDTCITDVDLFKLEVTSFTVNGVSQDTAFESEYFADVTLITDEGEKSFDVYFDFRGLVYDTTFYIHLNSSPFSWEREFLDYDPTDTVPLLTDFYDLLLGTGPSSDVCNYIIELDDEFDQPLSECASDIDYIRTLITLFTVDDVIPETITPPEGETIPGYKATITFDTTEGQETIEFIYGVTIHNRNSVIFPFGDPFGMDDEGEGPGFIIVESVSYAEGMILQYYEDLTAALVNTEGFCEYYMILDDEMQVMDAADCSTYKLTNLSTDPDEYVVNSVTFHDGEMPTYIASVTRGTETYEAYFYFTEDTFVTLWVVGNNATGDLIIDHGGGDGPTFVDIDEIDALMYITMFYHDIRDPDISDTDFCMQYLFLNDDMSPKDSVECEAFRAYAYGFGHVYILGDITFHPSSGGSPPYFEAEVTRMDPLPHQFVSYFFFVEGQHNPILVMTVGNNAIGDLEMNMEGGGGGLHPSDLTVEEAAPYITEFYVDLMDISLSSSDFCVEYIIQTDDMQPMEPTACVTFRDGVNTDYLFTISTLEFIEGQGGGPSAYVMNMTRTLDGVDVEYQAIFFIFEDDNQNIILFVTGNNAIGELIVPIGGGGGGPAVIDVDESTASAMINAYYNDIENASVPEIDVCTSYLLMDNEMSPYEEAYCTSEITDIRMSNFDFTTSNYVFTAATDDSPSYWTVEVERFNGVIIYIYNVSFLFIDSGDGTPMLAVQYEASVGMDQ